MNHSHMKAPRPTLLDGFGKAIAVIALVIANIALTLPALAQVPRVVTSVPAAGATEVPVGQALSLRFSVPLRASSISNDTVTLMGPAGVTAIEVMAAQGGQLVRILPRTELRPSAGYTLFIKGAESQTGQALPFTAIGFTTAALGALEPRPPTSVRTAAGDDETWTPGPRHLTGRWMYEDPPVSERAPDLAPKAGPPPLQAPPGITALAGQVSRVNGHPLPNVTVSIGAVQAQTDWEGRFLLSGLPAGPQVLAIDGRHPGPGNANYGEYFVRVEVKGGQTTVFPQTFWLNKLDPHGTVAIASPTIKETVVRSPWIPGLELLIPPGTVIRDSRGSVVREVNITPIPVDRPPFPLPGFKVPVYFTIQPGGAWLQGVTADQSKGARLIYPNNMAELAGARASFWNYDPHDKAWYIYGVGTVAADRKQVVPDPEVALYEFTGAMINSGLTPPPSGPAPGCLRGGTGPSPDPGGGGMGPPSNAGPGGNPGGAGDGGGNGAGDPPPPSGGGSPRCNAGGDPVDMGTGLYVHENSDLFLPDTWPLDLVRTYRQGDANSRPFGVGMTHPFEMFLWSANQYQEADLILPNGGRVHYIRTSSGSGFTDAVFESTVTPTRFYKSRIAWNGNGWDLTLKDGTVYVYGDTHPLQSMRDRYGNTVRFTRTSQDSRGTYGNITQITGPNGRFIKFTYDGSDRITSAQDNLGRTVSYSYDAYGRLTTITNPAAGVTTYGWGTCTGSQASCTWLQSVTDGRGNVRLANTFDGNGRVSQQTLADGATYQFSYTLASGAVTQADVTNPRGDVTRKTFANGYVTSTVEALGQPEQRTTTITRNASTNQIQSVTDPLGRVTAYAYDTLGNTTSVTRLSGTPNAVTTTFTYEPTYSRLASVVDPLGHTSTFAYDSLGNLVTATDALNHQTTATYTPAGQLASVIDALGHTTTFAYQGADLASVTNPLGRTMSRFVDAIGRVSALTDPLGNRATFSFDALNRLTQATDALGHTTASSYDANSNRVSFSDPRGGTTTWAYDSLNRAVTRTDALGQPEAYQYDLGGNLVRVTDRKGQVTGYQYDLLNRLTFAGFGASVGNPTSYTSSIAYTYDAGDRITQLVDTANGTITRSYDGLDRLVSESTPQGTVTYAYDAAGRRTQLSAPAQSTTTYTFDNANRLTAIARGSQGVTFGYDHANRRTSLVLPNGINVAYGYDIADQLTSISYVNGTTTVGDLTYSYDAAGRRIAQGGTFARVNLPSSISGASYDAGNRLSAWNGAAVTHDLNGNMTAALGQTYSWNERNQLTASTGSVTATFAYDGEGRRRGRTVNGGTTNFLYDGQQPIQELTSANVLSAALLTGGIDEIFSRSAGGVTQTFIVDALGSTVRLTDSAGAKDTDYTYEAYGKAANDNASNTNTFQYTGRENDGTQLQFNRARYYDPRLARFISEDPIGLAGGYNLFSYVKSNPVSYTDPSGLGPALFAVCSIANAVKTTSDFMGGVSSLLDSTKMTRDLLGKVNEEIASCPSSDTNRLNELNNIRRNLVDQLARTSRDFAADTTQLGMGEAAQGLIWQGACALGLLIGP
jgi:RHS repeat-associated protein